MNNSQRKQGLCEQFFIAKQPQRCQVGFLQEGKEIVYLDVNDDGFTDWFTLDKPISFTNDQGIEKVCLRAKAYVNTLYGIVL